MTANAFDEDREACIAADIRKLKEATEENSRLKRMYTDLALENTALKDVIAKKL